MFYYCRESVSRVFCVQNTHQILYIYIFQILTQGQACQGNLNINLSSLQEWTCGPAEWVVPGPLHRAAAAGGAAGGRSSGAGTCRRGAAAGGRSCSGCRCEPCVWVRIPPDKTSNSFRIQKVIQNKLIHELWNLCLFVASLSDTRSPLRPSDSSWIPGISLSSTRWSWAISTSREGLTDTWSRPTMNINEQQFVYSQLTWRRRSVFTCGV